MKRNIKISTSKLTLVAAFNNFLALKKSEGRVNKTLTSYRSHVRPFLAYCDGQKLLYVEQITEAIINEYKCHLVGREDITQDTKASYLRDVKCFMSYLSSIHEMVPFSIKGFRTPSKEKVSTYSDEELKKLIKCPWARSQDFGQLRDYTMMLTLLLTGARRDTVRNMKVEDVDFDNDLVTLRHIKRDTTFQIRQLPLNPDLKVALIKYLRKTGLANQCKYLFPNVEGNPFHPDSINKRMEKLFAAAGVEFRGCHEFRRTFATKSYSVLKDAETTRKLMLISDPRILRRYINTDMDELQESAQKLTFCTQITSPRYLRGKIKKGA